MSDLNDVNDDDELGDDELDRRLRLTLDPRADILRRCLVEPAGVDRFRGHRLLRVPRGELARCDLDLIFGLELDAKGCFFARRHDGLAAEHVVVETHVVDVAERAHVVGLDGERFFPHQQGAI